MAYRSEQIARLVWLVGALPLAGTAVVLIVTGHPDAGRGSAMLLATGIAVVALFGRLVIEVDGGAVRWRFGYLGWPRWSLALTDIVGVERASCTWLEGQGIRRTREGWLYNAGGSGTVRLTLHDGRRLRLGSAEPERLAAFIAARLPSR